MGALLSVPVLGYFLIPSIGTYSASLNLFFFYLTWSTLVLSQPPLKVEIIGTLAVRTLFFLAPSVLFLIFDTLLPSLAVGLKSQGALALPTRTGGVAGARTSRSKPQWYQVISLSIFNVFLGVTIQALVEVLFTDVLGIRSALKLTTTLPMPWSIATNLAKALLLREVVQYYSHRYLHSSQCPKLLGNLHASYFHSIRSPYSFATHYDHPFTYVLWRFLPTYLPAVIFRMHLLTYLVLLSITSLEETLTLSGYNCIPGIMLGGFARRQDLHSQSLGRGNFSPWGFLDWLHGTSIGPDVIDDVKDDAKKHQVAQRGSRALKNFKDGGSAGVREWRAGRKSTNKS